MHNPCIWQLGLSTIKVDSEVSSEVSSGSFDAALVTASSEAAPLLGAEKATVLESAKMRAKEEISTRIDFMQT